jgi:carboxymethylenebutenolidase
VPGVGLFGGADPKITAEHVEAFQKALDSGRIRNELVIYQGAPHSFFDRAVTEYARASQDAWTRVLAFVHRDPGDGLQPRLGPVP